VSWLADSIAPPLQRYAFDLHAAFPYHSLSDADRKQLWDDHLHPTEEGYARMGDAIADALIEYINNDN
jgi:lysophospholipase L1-like esterase